MNEFKKYIETVTGVNVSTSGNAQEPASNHVGTQGAEGKSGHRKKREDEGKDGRFKLQRQVVGDQSNDDLDNDKENRKKRVNEMTEFNKYLEKAGNERKNAINELDVNDIKSGIETVKEKSGRSVSDRKDRARDIERQKLGASKDLNYLGLLNDMQAFLSSSKANESTVKQILLKLKQAMNKPETIALLMNPEAEITDEHDEILPEVEPEEEEKKPALGADIMPQ